MLEGGLLGKNTKKYIWFTVGELWQEEGKYANVFD